MTGLGADEQMLRGPGSGQAAGSSRRQTGKVAKMFSLHKVVRSAFVAGFAVILATGSAYAEQMKIGSGATLNLTGKINSQVAFALGAAATAHNVVGGITSGGGLSIGDRASITTRADANSQVAFALGAGASASNNVGGVLGMGGLTSR